jgi:hypothetical protein
VRQSGCLIAGLLWSALFLFTLLGNAVGDAAPIDCTGQLNCDPYPARWTDYLLPAELVLLVLMAGFFYRRGKKDGEF